MSGRRCSAEKLEMMLLRRSVGLRRFLRHLHGAEPVNWHRSVCTWPCLLEAGTAKRPKMRQSRTPAGLSSRKTSLTASRPTIFTPSWSDVWPCGSSGGTRQSKITTTTYLPSAINLTGTWRTQRLSKDWWTVCTPTSWPASIFHQRRP